MESSKHQLSRRTLLKGTALLGLAGALRPFQCFGNTTKRKRTGLIAEENRKPGTTNWQLTFIKSKNYRSKLIEGFCSHTSVRVGDDIDVFISTDPATNVSIDLYRMGYYGGKGGRFIDRLGPFVVKPQPTPSSGKNRLRECHWKKTTSIKIKEDWISGVYLGKLSCDSHRYESYIIFVVRDDRKADLIFQTSDTTWQAYNKWPENDSMYDSDFSDRPLTATTWVSYDRPYGKYPQVVDNALSQGSGEFLLWEYPLCFWLEQHGYDVTYTSNIDTHADPEGLLRAKCFISVGHDEYWSLKMYDNVENAIKNGLSVAFLCGNSVNGVIPLDKRNWQGRPHRLMHRSGMFGGLTSEVLNAIPYWATEPWEEHGPSEAFLIGGKTMSPANGSANWKVTNENHWIFNRTGMKNGDIIPGLVGWEHHGNPPNIQGLEILATGKTIKVGGKESTYAATVYPGPKGNWIFNAATIFWSMGLSQPPGLVPPYSHMGRPHGIDERVQKITENFFKKCGVAPI